MTPNTKAVLALLGETARVQALAYAEEINQRCEDVLLESAKKLDHLFVTRKGNMGALSMDKMIDLSIDMFETDLAKEFSEDVCMTLTQMVIRNRQILNSLALKDDLRGSKAQRRRSTQYRHRVRERECLQFMEKFISDNLTTMAHGVELFKGPYGSRLLARKVRVSQKYIEKKFGYGYSR